MQSSLTQQVAARVEEQQRLSVANQLGQRVYDHRQVTTDVVHYEEEDADNEGAQMLWSYLDDDGEQNAHPHLSESVGGQQTYETVRRR